ncbi:MAG TPA: DUF58 domain-containing protein [Armatimonadota bacterium]|nr:DUF58 domain-containing protein [Armatimonadota bacterium]
MSPIKLFAVALAAVFMTIVSVCLHSAEFSLMAAALISVPVVSYVLGRIAVGGLKCSRECPEYAHEGEPVPVRLRLEGKSRLLGAIEMDDQLPQWVVRDDVHSRVTETAPGEIVASYSATALKRGKYTLGPLRLTASDPLGFCRFSCGYPLTSPLIVLPRALQIPELYIWAAGGLGEHQFEGAGAKGSGIEFHGVREYQAGDELRRVHWRSTARHGRLNVIEFEHSRAEDTLIAIDLKRGSEIGTGRFTSLECAVKIAAGVAEQALAIGSLARLACAGLVGPAATPGRGRGHLYVILDALARVEADQEETLSSVLLQKLDSITHGSDIVCLASSIDEGLPQCADLLLPRGARLQLVLFTLSDGLSGKTEQMARRLAASRASVTIVRCSPDTGECHVAHRYGN